jgi:hypothetical protein
MTFPKKYGWPVILIVLFNLGSILALAAPPSPTSTPAPITGPVSLGDLPVLPETEISAQQVITSSMFAVAFDGHQTTIITDSAQIKPQVGTSAEVTAAQATIITSENFEGLYTSIDPLFDFGFGPYGASATSGWFRVGCYSTPGFPVAEPFGEKSMTPAAVLNSAPTIPLVNPCQEYLPDMDVVMKYGPFDLSDAQDASLEFFYRFDTADPDDVFSWGASIDGTTFYYNQPVSGSYASGPFPNSHNFASFDLTAVPTLGNLSGQPNVWISFRFVSDGDSETGAGPFVDAVSLRKNTAPKRTIVTESFTSTFPIDYVSWLSSYNNPSVPPFPYPWRWGSADCLAQSGSNSMWMARYGANGVDPSVGMDPCAAPNFDALKNKQLDSWLIYGPFNLEGVNEAWLDFYFRGDTELISNGVLTTGDTIHWWASTDGTNYSGIGLNGGPFTAGPAANGYNRMRFDLGNVSSLGDLRGRPTVWLAFVFRSDGDDNIGATGEGFFLDDVNLVVIDNSLSAKLYLPVVFKSEILPVGGITFENFTGNPVVLELVGLDRRTYPSGTGPHVWDNIPVGVYDWVLSGTCPAGAGQIGSLPPSNRQKVIIEAGQLDNVINVENDGGNKFDCSG